MTTALPTVEAKFPKCQMMNWENKKAVPFALYWTRNKKYIIDRYREKRLTKA